jgi:hypothetical protein
MAEVEYSVEYDSDLEDFVQLRINDHVDQEWMIPNGPMRQEVIMLFAEQMERELADQEQRELATRSEQVIENRSEQELGAEPEEDRYELEDRYEFERNEVQYSVEYRDAQVIENRSEQELEEAREWLSRYLQELSARNRRERRPDLSHLYIPTTEVAQSTYVATEAQEGEDACIICMENVPDSIFDCGNKGFCCVCADKLLKTTRKCPLCRKTVTAFSVEKPEVEDDVPVSWEDL